MILLSEGVAGRLTIIGFLIVFKYFPLLKFDGSLSLKGAGDDPSAESEYLGGFCIDRKIDLTSYIKWWGPNKGRQADSVTKLSEEAKHAGAEDIGSELKKSEWEIQPMEPYQMPCLGVSHGGKKLKGSALSALSILSQSSAYKSFQEKALKKQQSNTDNDENENKNIINKMDYGKAVEKSTSHEGRSERLGAALGMTGGLSLQKNMFQLGPFLSAPLLTNYNTIDPLADPMLWTSLVPALPTGLSRNSEVGILTIRIAFWYIPMHLLCTLIFLKTEILSNIHSGKSLFR